MKIYTIQILLLLLVCSCNLKQEGKIESEKTDTLTNQIEMHVASTAYQFPDIELPQNYYIDSITIYDTVSRAKYNAYYLQSNLPEQKKFNQVIVQLVKDQIMIEQKYVDPYNGDSPIDIIYSYELRPTEIYLDSQLISISNIIDTYTEGGNHHNYTRYTFNYNLITNKAIEFNDVFSLQSKNDSTEFIVYAEQHVLNACTDWGWPYKYLDFSFAENGIYINPNLSWACISTRSLLPVDNNNKFIKKEWVKQKRMATKKKRN
jgi:hypothetical protein